MRCYMVPVFLFQKPGAKNGSMLVRLATHGNTVFYHKTSEGAFERAQPSWLWRTHTSANLSRLGVLVSLIPYAPASCGLGFTQGVSRVSHTDNDPAAWPLPLPTLLPKVVALLKVVELSAQKVNKVN